MEELVASISLSDHNDKWTYCWGGGGLCGVEILYAYSCPYSSPESLSLALEVLLHYEN
jgi:hypothetical protein